MHHWRLRLVWHQAFTAQCWQDRTAVLWCCNQSVVKPVTIIQDLGVWFDAELSMCSHVSHMVHCAVFMPSIDSLTATWQHSWLQHLSCRIWTTVSPCWLVFQLPHWHHFSLSCLPRHVLFWILSYATVWPRPSKGCTSYQSERKSSSSCACWSTRCFLDTHLCTSWTYWHQLPMYLFDLHCVLHRLVTSPCCRRVDKSTTGLSVSPHHEHRMGCRQLKLVWSTTAFRYLLKNFLFQSACGHWKTDWWWLFCDVPSVSQLGVSTGNSVIFTVTA